MTFRVDGDLPRIVAIQGATGAEIQALLAELAVMWKNCGLRIAGVVEESVFEQTSGRETLLLRDLKTGARYPLKQDLGFGSTSCALDQAGLAAACAAVETAISEGCDLVIISKFGKLEAARGGLADAFRAAIEADAPIVTSVSPSLTEAWTAFASPLTVFVSLDCDAIEGWRIALARANLETQPRSS